MCYPPCNAHLMMILPDISFSRKRMLISYYLTKANLLLSIPYYLFPIPFPLHFAYNLVPKIIT